MRKSKRRRICKEKLRQYRKELEASLAVEEIHKYNFHAPLEVKKKNPDVECGDLVEHFAD